MVINSIVVFSYLFAMVVLGLFLSKYVKKDDDFFLGGRSLNKWVIAGTIMATNVAAIYLVGPAAKAYEGGGVSVLLIAWTGNMIAAISALFFVPRLRRLRITTISEFLEVRYGLWLRLIPSILWIVYYALFAGNAMYTLSVVLNPVLGVHVNTIILVVGGGVVLYCFFSGFLAAAYSSVIQSFIMIIGGLILLPLSIKAIGGLSGFIDKVPVNFFVFWKAGEVWPTWKQVIMFTLLGFPYWCTSQYMLQRSFAGRSVREASKGVILAAILTGPLTLSFIIPGICGSIIYSSQNALVNTDTILPRLLVDILPVGLGGLIVAALVAASNSTASALLNSLATLGEHDFYRRFKPGKSSRHYLWIGRFITLIGGIIGLIFAFNVKRLGGIINANFQIMSFFEPPIFIIVAGALFWKHINPFGAFLTLVVGMAFSTIATFLGVSPADRTIMVFPICLVTIILGTMIGNVSKPIYGEQKEKIDALLSRMKGIKSDFSFKSGLAGIVISIISLTAFIGCAFFEEILPKPGNILIFMGLMLTFILGCYMMIPIFIPDEKDSEEKAKSAIDSSWTQKIISSGWVWLGVYIFAAVLVAILYVI